MPKKRRPIVMNRNKAPGKKSSIFKKALWITALLAIVEVIILIVLHFQNADKANVKTAEKETSKVTVQDTAKIITAVPPKAAVETQPKEKVATKDSAEIVKPFAEKVQVAVPKSVKDSPVIPEVKPKEIKPVKKVSTEKMFAILNEIRLVKMQANNPTKCVSIRIVNSSNAENGSRIATYLRNNGYVISGREIIGGSRKGIKVNAAGTCIELTIGDL